MDVNYDLPKTIDEDVYRIGSTGKSTPVYDSKTTTYLDEEEKVERMRCVEDKRSALARMERRLSLDSRDQSTR